MTLFAAEPLAACAATLMCLTAPAHPAEPALQLTLRGAHGAATSVSLECEPSGGTHPRATAACSALLDVDGDFTRLPDRHESCALIYAPVTAQARGTWHGHRVKFDKDFPNRCVADVATNGVFGF